MNPLAGSGRAAVRGALVLILSLGALTAGASGASASTTVTDISAGGGFACAIVPGGSIDCWGLDTHGQVSGPSAAAGAFTDVSAGAAHTCAIATGGDIQCWGLDEYGEVAGPDAAAGTFISVDAGVDHTCALATGGDIQCWGQDAGSGVVSGPNAAVGTFVAVEAGSDHTCALASNGDLQCWGSDGWGEVSGPNAEAGPFIAVSAQGPGTCAIHVGGQLECWGYDLGGQVSGPNSAGGTFVAVSHGAFHTCAIHVGGAIECWEDSKNLPHMKGPNTDGGSFTQIAAGNSVTCGIRTDNRLACWDSTYEMGQAPFNLGPETTVATVGVAFDHQFKAGWSASPDPEFSVGPGLPPGLTLSPNGLLSGTPTAAGLYSFTVTADNFLGSESKIFILPVNDVVLDSTAPVITPDVDGQLGLNGWYTSDVEVSWTVIDAESEVTATDGCDAITIDDDTDGITLTCSATSAGGSSSASVTIKRDATAPGVSCSPAPFFVLGGSDATDVTATVTDATSGPADPSIEADVTAANVATVGVTTKSLTGTDGAGNSTTVSCGYVVGYQFGGFLEPLPQAKAKAGSSIPVKFTLKNAAGTTIPDAGAQSLVGSPCRIKVSFAGQAQAGCPTYDAVANVFKFDLKTTRQSPKGTQTVTIEVSAPDGSGLLQTHSIQVVIT